MATSRVVVLECDACGSTDESVKTHEVGVDGRTVEVEVCGRCWTAAERGSFFGLLSKGRRKRKARK